MLGQARITAGGPLVGVAQGQWYRLITSAFLPPPGLSGLGPLDIVFNMWALILVGPAAGTAARAASGSSPCTWSARSAAR